MLIMLLRVRGRPVCCVVFDEVFIVGIIIVLRRLSDERLHVFQVTQVAQVVQ